MPSVKHRRRTAQLTTSDGKGVCVQANGSSYRLVLKNVQISNQNASKVTVYEFVDKDKPTCMAFCFELKNERHTFPVIADHGETISFKVLPKAEHKLIDKTYLFQWGEELGDLRTLKSVAVPNKYLAVDKKSNQVTITSTAGTLFKIKYMTRNRKERVQTRGSTSCVAVRQERRQKQRQ